MGAFGHNMAAPAFCGVIRVLHRLVHTIADNRQEPCEFVDDPPE
jgi:hypothetical protein